MRKKIAMSIWVVKESKNQPIVLFLYDKKK